MWTGLSWNPDKLASGLKQKTKEIVAGAESETVLGSLVAKKSAASVGQ